MVAVMVKPASVVKDCLTPWAKRQYVHRRLNNWGRYIRNGLPADIPRERPRVSYLNVLMAIACRRYKDTGPRPPDIDEEQAEITHQALVNMEANGERGRWVLTFYYAHKWEIRDIAEYQMIKYDTAKKRLKRARQTLYKYMV